MDLLLRITTKISPYTFNESMILHFQRLLQVALILPGQPSANTYPLVDGYDHHVTYDTVFGIKHKKR